MNLADPHFGEESLANMSSRMGKHHYGRHFLHEATEVPEIVGLDGGG